MFCTNCGNEVADNAVVCVKCGVSPRNAKKFCHNCGTAITEDQVVCVKCGVPLTAATGTLPNNTAQAPKALSQSNIVEQIKGLLKPAKLPPRTADIEVLAAGPQKSRALYIVLALFLGHLGIHNFYAGYRQRAVASLLCMIPPCCCLLGILSMIGAWVDIFGTKCDAAGRPMQ